MTQRARLRLLARETGRAGQTTWASAIATACAVAASACSSNAPPATSGTGDAAAPDDARVDAPVGDDGPVNDDASTGTGADSSDGAIDGEGGDAAIMLPPVCDPSSRWSTIVRVTSIASNGFDRFGGISPDELTVAWTTAAGTILVADRTSTSQPFGGPVQLDPGTLMLANDRVALPDNLDLIATLADRSSFVHFIRASVTDPWKPVVHNDFRIVNSVIAESGGAFASPVAGAYSDSLFYLLTDGPAPGPVLYESTWSISMNGWTSGTPPKNTDFTNTMSAPVRRPTGVSSDRLTLFFFDEVTGKERAAWRSSPKASFDKFVELPMLPEAAPAGDCLSVYFHGNDVNGQGLFQGTGP